MSDKDIKMALDEIYEEEMVDVLSDQEMDNQCRYYNIFFKESLISTSTFTQN